MVLYLGDWEMLEYIQSIYPNVSSEISMEEADKIIISEHSHATVSCVRYADAHKIPLLGILDGYKSVAEGFGADCIPVENCAEGKQELAILDTAAAIHKNIGHVTLICRGDPSALDEDAVPPELDCIARAETGEIISFCKKNADGIPNIYAVNYYLNSPLTQCGDIIIKNFIKL